MKPRGPCIPRPGYKMIVSRQKISFACDFTLSSSTLFSSLSIPIKESYKIGWELEYHMEAPSGLETCIRVMQTTLFTMPTYAETTP